MYSQAVNFLKTDLGIYLIKHQLYFGIYQYVINVNNIKEEITMYFYKNSYKQSQKFL